MADRERGEGPARPRNKDAGEAHHRELARARRIIARWVIEPHEPKDVAAPGHVAIE